MSLLPSTPLQSVENSSLRDVEGTPVGLGNRDKEAKIQLCIEIRERQKKTTARKPISSSTNKKNLELVLEVTVMHLKNLSRRKADSKRTSSSPVPSKTKKLPQVENKPTFVKIQLIPGSAIYSSELKMDKQNQEKVDLNFIEVFAFPLESLDSLKNTRLNILVCDKKMTRNATIFGEISIDLTDYKMEKPVCKWFPVQQSPEFSGNKLAKP